MATDEYKTDFESHRIQGLAAAAIYAGKSHADSYFDVPLISHIQGNLYSGGCRDGVKLDDDFDYVLSVYKWERYKLGSNTTRAEFKMFDDDTDVDVDNVLRIAEMAHDFAQHGKTLIHCQAGLNRSGLISSLVLMKDGMSAQEAIDLLREKRSPLVLCNQNFELWLKKEDWWATWKR